MDYLVFIEWDDDSNETGVAREVVSAHEAIKLVATKLFIQREKRGRAIAFEMPATGWRRVHVQPVPTVSIAEIDEPVE